ncbi:hypothetical protein GETHPA_20340 [Geothrix rubra]|uniref:STAS/SEC14 domain-containing protein n=1 Tax=Geothrix rubra TaxID=2927977 RepID=A0ABQ5Q7Q6_9BACT|nr:hypothetical protein [Geothrix rubra]GLH70501.1 hypothetical protein GETHPA_20340 [Geothrix rubra]
MEWSVDIDPEAALVRIRAWGAARLEGFVGYAREVQEHPAWQPGMAILVDLQDLDLTPMKADDINRLVAIQKTYSKDAVSGPIATVVSRLVDFGIVRMWEAHVSSTGRNHRVFTDLDEARAWLLQQTGRSRP